MVWRSAASEWSTRCRPIQAAVQRQLQLLVFMLNDGVILEANCPSPPRSGGMNRAVIATPRSGSVGTQVVASAGRSRGDRVKTGSRFEASGG